MLESAISTVLGTLRSSLELRTLLGLTEVTGIDSRKPCNESTVARDLRRFPSLAKGMDAEPPSTSTFGLEIHPSVDRVSVEVNEYFLQHWPFRSDKERFKFRAADFPRVTCLYFPRALDERIGFACRLLTLLFLVDDLLEEMGLEEGAEYNERLISISKGETQPDRGEASQWMTHELWQDMRACDYQLAEEIKDPVFTFMRAQTDGSRLTLKELGAYFEYREKDVGQALLSALMRFSMALRLTPEQLEAVSSLERNCARHIAVVNDIYSWRKELLASETLHQEGAALCSSVQVLASEGSLGYPAAQRVLWAMCREWEATHRDLVENLRQNHTHGVDRVLEVYVCGLENQMSGNERWSESTPRYHTIK